MRFNEAKKPLRDGLVEKYKHLYILDDIMDQKHSKSPKHHDISMDSQHSFDLLACDHQIRSRLKESICSPEYIQKN